MVLSILSNLPGIVAPVRERGLKFPGQTMFWRHEGRSRKGAWIEMPASPLSPFGPCVAPVRERGLKWFRVVFLFQLVEVAPVRERGLKFSWQRVFSVPRGRSREGAWIEIKVSPSLNTW